MRLSIFEEFSDRILVENEFLKWVKYLWIFFLRSPKFCDKVKPLRKSGEGCKVQTHLVYNLKPLINKNLSWVCNYGLLQGNKIFLILNKWRTKLVMRLWQGSWSRCGNCGTSSWQWKETHQLDVFWKWKFIIFKPQYRSQYLNMVVITAQDFDGNTRWL